MLLENNFFFFEIKKALEPWINQEGAPAGDASHKNLIENFLEVEKIKKERDGLDFRGAFPGAVRRAPLACYWLFYMCPS